MKLRRCWLHRDTEPRGDFHGLRLSGDGTTARDRFMWLSLFSSTDLLFARQTLKLGQRLTIVEIGLKTFRLASDVPCSDALDSSFLEVDSLWLNR